MAGVHQYGWKVIPAVRSGYGADTLPDQCRSEGEVPIQQCTALAAEEHKVFYFETDGTKGFFAALCLPPPDRQHCNNRVRPLIQYTAEPFTQSGFWMWHFFLHHACSESSNSLLFFCLTTRCAGLVNDGDTCLRESNKWLATILGTKLC